MRSGAGGALAFVRGVAPRKPSPGIYWGGRRVIKKIKKPKRGDAGDGMWRSDDFAGWQPALQPISNPAPHAVRNSSCQCGLVAEVLANIRCDRTQHISDHMIIDTRHLGGTQLFVWVPSCGTPP